jgi:hypothetical protein
VIQFITGDECNVYLRINAEDWVRTESRAGVFMNEFLVLEQYRLARSLGLGECNQSQATVLTQVSNTHWP